MYDIERYNQMMQKLKGGIIVSCQSKQGDPTHCPEFRLPSPNPRRSAVRPVSAPTASPTSKRSKRKSA